LTDNRQTRTSCEIPARLALVIRGEFLVFAVLELAVLAGKATPGSIVVLANPPRF
jgi:hypothetical protein